MASAEITEMRNNPEYKNFYAVSNAFKYLCEGLRPFAEREMKRLHSLLISKTSGAVCKCQSLTGKSNPHTYVKTSCIWAKELGKLHCMKKKSSILWHQSDSTKWHDPTNGYWEIAKIFMSSLGDDRSKVKDPSSTDATGLLNLLYSCTYFKVQQKLVKSVRTWRNKLAHSPNQLLTDLEKNSAIDDILKLLDDPKLLLCREVQDCRKTIDGMRSSDFSILPEVELQIWKEVNRYQSNNEGKKKQKKMEKELKAAQRKESDISHNLEGVKPESNPQAENTIHASGVFFISLIHILCGLLHSSFRNISKYYWWIFILIVSKFVGVGDKAMLLSDSGCFRASVKSPINHFQFQEFNFTSHLTYRRTNFFGRKWLFQDLENIFETDQEAQGVLIIGEPGSGKSAVMSQLICSPHSSLLIHDNIVGYHMCDYSEKGKRDGPRFVRNLVDQIAGSIPEYSDRIAENEQIRRMLDKCEKDVVGCFYGAIVAPLREIKNQSLQFVVIDALDECMEKDGKTSEILKILSNKILDFPNWLKLILSSRNWTTITKTLPQLIRRITLDPADQRNLEDIHSYITYFLFRNSYFMDRLSEAMGLTSTTEGINSLVNELSKKGGGNFLFVTTTLQYLNNSSGRINLQSFPTRLYDTYSIYFRRLFDEENFTPFRTFFEVLLASNSPLRSSDIDMIFKLQNLTYKASELVKKVSCFLRFGENGTVWIYHQSFAEWLMNQTDHTGWLFIAKSRGHQFVAEYYFEVIRQKLYSPSLHELTELATHSLAGGITEELKLWLRQRLKLMNVSKIRDPNNEGCILHNLAMNPTSTPLLNIFLDAFPAVDIPDTLGLTPAFYAALGGHVEHLKLFIKKGININYIVKNKVLEVTIPVYKFIFKKSNLFEDFSLVHIAAFMGHTKIIKVLIKSGASFREFGGEFGETPLQVAARQNHLEVVKLLCQYGVQADVTALHHAAAKNHTDIVRYLLKHTNVRDECLPCKPGNISNFDENTTLHDIHISFCETALHAAVSRGHLEIVKLLLYFGNASLECKHHSGKSPLMAAVERNDQEMVALLLEAGADVEAACDHEITQLSISTKYICLFPTLFERLYTLDCGKDICSYSNRAIHLCAKYGFWEIAKKLIRKWNANMLALTSDGEIPISIATNYDRVDFVNNFTRFFSKKIDDIVENEKVLLRAAVCGSSKTLKWLLSQITDRNYFSRQYPDGMTLLHYASSWSPYPNSTNIKLHFCLQGQSNRHCIRNYNCSVLAEELKREYENRLRVVKLLVQSQKDVSSFVNKKDDHGRTALHHAAFAGFAGAVRFLVRQGSWRSKDRDGNRPLDLALTNSPKYPEFFNRCLSTNDKVFRTCNTTLFDETLKYLLWLNRSNIKKCDAYTALLLDTIVVKWMPLSLYTLLKIGADVNCSVGRSIRPFLRHLSLGGEQIGEVFKIFEINVTLECNVPFDVSELHLISHAYVSSDIGNFFKSSINNQLSPIQRLASYHPKGIRIFDECRDKEGYLPIHRAAQGGNFEAIEWFISSGVNLSLKTQSGLTALDLSIMILDQLVSTGGALRRLRQYIDLSVEKIVSSVKNPRTSRIRTFQKMLEGNLKGMGYDWYSKWCNPKLETLSPLHIASTKGIGMFEFVYKKVTQIAPDAHIPLNCTNKHGVTPLYLAYIYENAQIPCNYANLSSFKASHLNVDKTYLKYPVREAEYHIIYNYFYNSLCLQLNVTLFELNDIPDCPGFDDLLPKKKTLDTKMKQCNYDCLPFTIHVQDNVMDAFPSFDFQEYDVCKLGAVLVNKLKMFELQYFVERNRVDDYLAQQVARGLKCTSECRCIEIMQLLQTVFTCSKSRNDRHVNKFIAKRMGWTDMPPEGDVQERWPFHFLFKKIMKKYKSFDYLKNLNGRGIILGNSTVYCDFNNSEDENNDNVNDESGN